MVIKWELGGLLTFYHDLVSLDFFNNYFNKSGCLSSYITKDFR